MDRSGDQYGKDTSHGVQAGENTSTTVTRLVPTHAEREGGQDGDKWERRMADCQKCGKYMQNRSLRQHLTGVHDIYESKVVEEHLLVW